MEPVSLDVSLYGKEKHAKNGKTGLSKCICLYSWWKEKKINALI